MTEDNNSGTIRVVSAVADKNRVILYKEDGDTVTVNQGDHRLQALLDEIIPITTRGEVAVISLDKFSVYADFEKQSGGIVRFFKTARKALGSLLDPKEGKEVVIINMEFTPDITAPQLAGLLDQVEGYVMPYVKQNQQPQADPVLMAVDMTVGGTQETVLERLEPIGQDDVVESDQTVLAIINGIMIPDVDKLKPLILHATKTNSVASVQNFLARAAAIISQRAHSVVDLMRFLEKGDLPLAEDGSIIAYKVLRNKPNQPGYYVDCHSGNVPQRVGSYVVVDESLVDPNRRNECSNGLHIARRGYLRGFGGDVCVLCKIDPEDVMVVPHNDPNKVRVKGYHILAELAGDAYQQLRNNRPMTEVVSALTEVRNAIQGKHIGRIEEVRIRAQYGGNILVTPLQQQTAQRKAKASVEPGLTANEKKQAAALDDKTNSIDNVAPSEINKRVNAEIEKSKTTVKSKGGKSGVPPMGQVATEEVNKDNKPEKMLANKTVVKSQKTKAESPTEESKKSSVKGTNKEKSPAGSSKLAEFQALPSEQREALSLLWSGISQSEASRRTSVSRRTIGRLTDKFGTKSLT